MHDRTPCTMFASALFLAATLPAPALAGSPKDREGDHNDALPIAISVTADLGEGEAATSVALKRKAAKLAKVHGLKPSSTGDATLMLEVRWASDAHARHNITVTTTTSAGAVSEDRFGCDECTQEQLVAETAAHIAPLLSAIAHPQDRAQPAEPMPMVVTMTDTSPQGSPLGTLGWVGVGAVALGGSGLLSGLTFLGIAQKRVANTPTNIRYYQEIGYGLVAGGVVALAAGVTLILLDKTSKSRKRHIAVVPAIAPTQLGASAVVRF